MEQHTLETPITQTLADNYMPYAMSVIVSRAIPEIDGFKPSHRKLLYTMYKMGLLSQNANRVKSANVVGQTMRLNPHGEGAIYETLVRLSRGHEALLHPFVDSKGNFGKTFSRDMAYAASRYTEVRLEKICGELFESIDSDAVDFVDNYENTLKEPVLLPTTYPNVLVSANQGIAVGMASSICGFNLVEVCETAIELIKNPEHELASTLRAPDFPTGGEIIFNADAMNEIYRTGRGQFKVRARYRYIPEHNCIEIFEIPYTTTVEAIMDKVSEHIKSGKIKDIADMRDETDLMGLKLTIDLKRGADRDKLMRQLFRLTPLMDTFSCNFNILIEGTPKVMGVKEILSEWTAWRLSCVRRELYFNLNRLKDKLHLLKGLSKILLDIDRAIKIIRETDEETEVIPNLMIGFGIDERQAEYIAEIRLRNINRQYILKRVQETEELSREISGLEDILSDKSKMLARIVAQLERVISKYGTPRRSNIIFEEDCEPYREEESIEDYPVNFFLTWHGYFKKITPLSLRMGGEQKLKEDDEMRIRLSGQNSDELLFFTNRQQVYKGRAFEFDDAKASVLGDYLPARLGMDEGETVVFMAVTRDFSGSMIFFFENGKAARVELKAYQTVTNRKRLSGAYSDKSPLVSAMQVREECEIAVCSSAQRAVVFFSALITPKPTRNIQGVAVITLKKGQKLTQAAVAESVIAENLPRYRVANIPAAGAVLRPSDAGNKQLTL